MGKLNCMRTADPLFFPGIHRGMFFTTRKASASRAGLTEVNIFGSVIVPSASTIKPTNTLPCSLFSWDLTG